MAQVNVTYQVIANSTAAGKVPAVMDIDYIDKNGNMKSVTSFSSPTNVWSLSFVGNTGTNYFCAGIDTSDYKPCTVNIYKSGTLIDTAAHTSTNTKTKVGKSGTL